MYKIIGGGTREKKIDRQIERL